MKRELLFFVIIVLFFLSNFTPVGQYLNRGAEFVFTPLNFYSARIGEGIKDFGAGILSVSELRKSNNNLLVENAQLRAENEAVSLILEENQALKKQLKLGIEKAKLLEVEIVSASLEGNNDFLIVNKGSEAGIKDGDVAMLGNIFIGIVSDTQKDSSRIVLPNNRANFLEVIILNTPETGLSVEALGKDYFKNRGSAIKGIAIGSSSGIKIENIDNGAQLKIGQIVAINDVKVGHIIYLGIISKVVADPTAIQKVAYVQPIVEYRELDYLFIDLGND